MVAAPASGTRSEHPTLRAENGFTREAPAYVLGLNLGHDPSAALLDGRGLLLAAAHEARLTRNKKERRFPARAIASAMATAGVPAGAVAAVAYTNYEADSAHNVRDKYLCGEGALDLAPTALMEQRLRAWGFEHFELARLDHHNCHAATALFCGGDPDALVVTADGYGDGLSMTVRRAQAGQLPAEGSAHWPLVSSLGLVYQYVTGALGFSMLSDEWKLLGLEHDGDPAAVNDLFERLMEDDREAASRWQVDRLRPHLTTIDAAGPPNDGEQMAALFRHFESQVPQRSRHDVAAGAQDFLEREVVSRLLPFLDRLQPVTLALAGGLFLNVKLNRRLAELPGVGKVAVFPAAGDGGNAVGAALAYLHRRGVVPPVDSLRHMFWGANHDADIDAVCDAWGLGGRRLDDAAAADAVADAVAQGAVVGIVRGRSEFGPRALLHRSLVCRTDRPELAARLNAALARETFMPYGCSMLDSEARRALVGAEPLAQCLSFMVAAVRATEGFAAEHRAVCHPLRGGGWSTRPQLVADDDGWDGRLLNAVGRRTGFAGVLNTSFNLHGEPIVETPQDALASFKAANLPGSQLLLGNRLLTIDEVRASRVRALKPGAAAPEPRRRFEACVCAVAPADRPTAAALRSWLPTMGLALVTEATLPACAPQASDAPSWSNEALLAFVVRGTQSTRVLASAAASVFAGRLRVADNGMLNSLLLQRLLAGDASRRAGIYADLAIRIDGAAELAGIAARLAERTSLCLAGVMLDHDTIARDEEPGDEPISSLGVAVVVGTWSPAPAAVGGSVWLYAPDGWAGLKRRLRQASAALSAGDFRRVRECGLVLAYGPDPACEPDAEAIRAWCDHCGVDALVTAAPGLSIARSQQLDAIARDCNLAIAGGGFGTENNAGRMGAASHGLARFINRFPGLEI